MNLTPRLQAVADCVPQGARLADVGTDHGYLPAWLLLEGRIPSAIATDLRAAPLSKAADTAEKHSLTDRMKLRLCDGLSAVMAEEVDAVTIAGMGGETILAILNAAPWALGKSCIVQPMSSLEDLRGGLEALGGHIAAERLAREGDTLYVVMELASGAEHLTPAECWAGKTELHRDDPLWEDYLAQRRHRAQRALAGLEKSSRREDTTRREWLRAVLAELPDRKQGR